MIYVRICPDPMCGKFAESTAPNEEVDPRIRRCPSCGKIMVLMTAKSIEDWAISGGYPMKDKVDLPPRETRP